MRLVLVEWVDSCSFVGSLWIGKDNVEGLDPHSCKSVGWIVKEDDECIVLAASLSDHEYSGNMCIPKVCITKMIDLNAPKKPK